MFGGYTEVAAYYVNTPWQLSGEHGPEVDSEQLPSDYNAQNVCPDPWHKRAACQNDFIMIAEFSEQEGPKPLIIIPKDGGGSFDLNEFSVRIMSADFQTASGSTFNMSEDTQVIMSETTNGLYAFVHHFTLYDYQARGFVRPFCMSYVTPDQNKLFSEFEDLSSQFKKVAHCFKSGNLDLFVKDLTHYLSDLHYTKQRYLEMEQSLESLTEDDQHEMSFVFFDPQEETLLKTVTLTALDNIIKEIKAILEVTSNTLTELEVISPVADPDESVNCQRPVDLDVTGKGVTDRVTLDNFRYSCSLHSRSPSHVTQWTNHRERAGSVSQVVSNWTDEKDIYKPKLVRTTKRRFEKSLRTIHELCMWGAKEGINRLRNLHKYFSRDLYVLHMEQIDAESMDPVCGVLTVGRTIIMNFMDQLDLERCVTDTDWDSTNSNSCLDRRWFSSETMASYHSADSFLSCVEDMPFTRGQHSTPLCLAGNEATAECDIKDGTKNNDMPSSGSAHSADISVENLNFSRSPSTTGSLETRPETSSLSKPEEITSAEAVALSELCPQPIKVNVISSVDHMTCFNKSTPGFGVQQLLLEFPSLCHVIYSLLIGRPTLVFATVRMEKEVRFTVNALSMFVPGYSNFSGIVAYHRSPLCITDIVRAKLIGLCRPERRKLEHMVPSSVRQYVTVFDIEKKTILAPQYKGDLLKDLCNMKKPFSSEQIFVTYIHSILYHLAVKSYMYFHKFCLGCSEARAPYSNRTNEDCWLSPYDRMLFTEKSVCDLEKLHINGQDMKIIQYFAEVVKHQHISKQDETESSSCTANLEYINCSWRKAST